MPDTKINSTGKLVDALDGDPGTIRLERGSVHDLTEYTLPSLPHGGALVSGDDLDDGPTATLIYSKRVDRAVLRGRGDFRWAGIEFCGPNHDREPLDRSKETIGLWLFGENAIVERSSFHGWPVAGLQTGAVNPHRETDAYLANTSFHHCLMDGYGYGVELINGHLEADAIEADWTRHAVASQGRPSSSYDVHHSWFGRHTLSHVIDVHGRERDSGPPVAGGQTVVRANTIEATHDLDGRAQEAVKFRGVPAGGAIVTGNRFAHPEAPKPPGSEGSAVYQEYTNRWNNVFVFDNQYGAT